MRQIADAEILNRLLTYDRDTGKLFWNVRDSAYFRDGPRVTSAGYAAQWNAKYAGKEAFTAKNRKGYAIGAVLGVGLLAHRVAWVGGDKWPVSESVWRCPVCDTEYHDNGDDE